MGSVLSHAFRSSWVLNMIWAGTGLLTVALTALYIYQDNLLYHPSIPGVPKTPKENPPGFRSPEDHGVLDYEEHFIKTDDGAVLHAWLMLHRESKSLPTVVYFHGNAGNMGFRLPHGTNIFKQCKVNVLLMDYRGYGSSQGEPSEEGLKKDAKAVLNTLQSHERIAPDKIILYGKSLGGAVAISLTREHPTQILAVILENTFLSIPAMVDELLPFVKYFKSLILRIGWHNDREIGLLPQPLLFISGLADELVPPSHMRELRRLARRSRLAEFYTVADGTHNDTMFKGGISYYRNMKDFILRVLELDSSSGECIANLSRSSRNNPDDSLNRRAEGAIPMMPTTGLNTKKS